MKVRFISALVAALTACVLLPATSSAAPASQGCDGSHHSDTGHGANQGGPYDNTCDGSPSGNGNGNGQATGKPCAGCVGNADDKNPGYNTNGKGQMPNGSDHNAGYECDRNHGIGRTNPAHTGCKTSEQTPPPSGGCTGDMSGGNTSGDCTPPPSGGCTGDMSGGNTSGDCTPPPSGGCPDATVGGSLSQAAVVALKVAALVHPELSKLADLAETKTADSCGNGGDTGGEHDNGNGHTPITICHATGSATN